MSMDTSIPEIHPVLKFLRVFTILHRISHRINIINRNIPTGGKLFLRQSVKAIPKAYKKISRENGLFRNIGNNGI